MSIQLMKEVWEFSKQKGSAKFLLITIANFANENFNGQAWPSIETLAKWTGLTPRTIKLLLHKLEESGELNVYRGAGPHRCNVYTVQSFHLADTADTDTVKNAKQKGKKADSEGAKNNGHGEKSDSRGGKKLSTASAKVSPNPLENSQGKVRESLRDSLPDPAHTSSSFAPQGKNKGEELCQCIACQQGEAWACEVVESQERLTRRQAAEAVDPAEVRAMFRSARAGAGDRVLSPTEATQLLEEYERATVEGSEEVRLTRAEWNKRVEEKRNQLRGKATA